MPLGLRKGGYYDFTLCKFIETCANNDKRPNSGPIRSKGSKPQGHGTGKAQRNIESQFSHVHRGTKQRWEDLCISKKDQAHETYDKGNQKEGNPNVIEHHAQACIMSKNV